MPRIQKRGPPGQVRDLPGAAGSVTVTRWRSAPERFATTYRLTTGWPTRMPGRSAPRPGRPFTVTVRVSAPEPTPSAAAGGAARTARSRTAARTTPTSAAATSGAAASSGGSGPASAPRLTAVRASATFHLPPRVPRPALRGRGVRTSPPPSKLPPPGESRTAPPAPPATRSADHRPRGAPRPPAPRGRGAPRQRAPARGPLPGVRSKALAWVP
ncbi:CRISPR-associated protein Cas5 [Streptomyces sp. enrichment culture]|uniref:CRISPR-associated protein Cas5 n=1 Tax=Streptomyces sp. enrichment culture TaxID=1795815 RepID=UPI003F547AC0